MGDRDYIGIYLGKFTSLPCLILKIDHDGVKCFKMKAPSGTGEVKVWSPCSLFTVLLENLDGNET